jgi:hypothetical protein
VKQAPIFKWVIKLPINLTRHRNTNCTEFVTISYNLVLAYAFNKFSMHLIIMPHSKLLPVIMKRERERDEWIFKPTETMEQK